MSSNIRSAWVLLVIALCIVISPALALLPNSTYHTGNVLYLPMNGTANSTSFPDLSPSAHVITPFGNAQVFTNPVKFGSGSLVSRTSGDYLSIPSSGDFDSGVFTLSMWFNPSELNNATFSKFLYKRDTFQVHFDDQAGGTRIRVTTGSGSINFLTAGIAANTWNYLLLSYDGTNFVANVNGVNLGSQALGFPAITGDEYIGLGTVAEQNYIGYIDDFIYLKGIYQSNTAVPITEYVVNPYASYTASATTGSLPLIVQFTNTTNQDVTAQSWTFRDAAGNDTEIQFSTGSNPLYTFGSVGNYTINYTVTNVFGSSSAYSFVNVSVGYLVADFMANQTTGYPNDYFQFTDLTTDAPTTWNWTFGDGGTSTVQNPVHQYTSVGSYDVSLNVTNTTSFDLATKPNYIVISVLPPPSTPSFIANKTYSTETPFAVLFNDTTPVVIRFLYRNWSFGDGSWYNTTSTSDNSTVHSYTTVGNYNVTLYETNGAGTTTKTSTNFIIVSNPTLVMYPQDFPVSRGVTGLMTIRASNLSHVDGGATNISFNKTAVTIDSITANATSSQNFTITSVIDNSAGSASIGVTCVDISSLSSNVDIVDIVWRANTTKTNETAPVSFNSTAFTSFIKSNSSYNGFRYSNITYLIPGVITLSDQTWMRTLYFKNAYNLNPISGIQVRISYTGAISGSDTTTTGTYDLSSTYGTVSVTAAADGYYNVTQNILFNGDGSDIFLMTPLSGAPGQTTWYIPQQVRIYAVNSMGAPIEGVYITCTPLNFTAPEDWTQILIGIQPSVNMSGTTLDGWTGSDGSWVAPMLSSFQYEFHLVNSSQGINHSVRFNPLDTSYRIYVNTVSQPNNTLLQVAQSSLPFYKLNSSGYYNLSMIYQDALGYTTHLQFNVKDYTHGNTLVYTNNWSNPGTGVIIDNYTVYLPQGQEYTWQYNATKV